MKRTFTMSSLLVNSGVLLRGNFLHFYHSVLKTVYRTADFWQMPRHVFFFYFSNMTQIQYTNISITNLDDSLVALKRFKYVVVGFVM